MTHQEKKYRVESFDIVLTKLKELGAKKTGHTENTHYYAVQPGKDVTKLVHYESKDEIHLLKENGGQFALTDEIPMSDVEAGLKWLKDKGHNKTTTVNMSYDEYSYKDGTVGLYLINDFLHAVILDFPLKEHDEVGKVLGLTKAEVIKLPFNKYLETVDKP